MKSEDIKKLKIGSIVLLKNIKHYDRFPSQLIFIKDEYLNFAWFDNRNRKTTTLNTDKQHCIDEFKKHYYELVCE